MPFTVAPAVSWAVVLAVAFMVVYRVVTRVALNEAQTGVTTDAKVLAPVSDGNPMSKRSAVPSPRCRLYGDSHWE